LIGVAHGLDLILTGRTVRSARAKRLGLIDEAAPLEQLMATARRRAIEAIGRAQHGPGSRRRRTSATDRLRTLALERNPIGRRLLFRNTHRIMMQRTKGHYPAPPAALRAVRTGVEHGFEAGLAAEAAEFAGLLTSPEAKALMSIYFASQALKRDTGAGPEVEPRSIGAVGIVGGGLMGGGIGSVNLIRAGVPTVIKEIDDAGVARALAHVEAEVEAQANRRRTSPSQIAAVEHLLSGTTAYADLSSADLVIEAVFEDLDLKRSVLAEVEAATGDETIFASNTSSIPISDIAAGAARPQNVIGMHYFSPVERMPLLEIITTEATSEETIATCVAFGKQQAKTVIVVNDGPGFFTTRVLAPYAAEVLHLLQDGARIEDIDSAMVDWGFPVGPITLSDEVGIDVGAKIGVIMQQAFGDRMRAPHGYAALIEDGRKGRKNGRGFYRYAGGKRSGVDASVYELLGVSPTGAVSRKEIQSRLSAQMVNEAARCLEEGVLRSARDGDIGAVMGLGFPPFRGGPFFYIDQAGAEAFVASLDALAAAHGPRFEAAPILREYAATGRAFRS
jgi:3-hydroxyacyl-CoA dehydrogenase/enoyl-CoA hydratase/3-hydroxybutyryl-CoA epimerase